MNPWHFLIFVVGFSLAGFLVQFIVWLHGVYIDWRYPKQIVVMSDLSRHSFHMDVRTWDSIKAAAEPLPEYKWGMYGELLLSEQAKHGTITGLTNV